MSDQTGDTTTTLVKALSGASFGLGVSELVAPGKSPPSRAWTTPAGRGG
ncbi:hypothetical protein [Mycobacterium colombiense]|nr:hypothetical protein [Mycobacterium colombiense]MCK8643579.1 hypothetical protein [Mycobacterium colombiense]